MAASRRQSVAPGSHRQSVVTPGGAVTIENLYPTNHLFVLAPNNPFRRACVAISTSKVFESFIMLAIAANCVMMAMNAPLPNDDKSSLSIKLVCSLKLWILVVPN